MPRVSVIIPNYNHERFLKQRIDSVLNQTYPDIEVIIMDDNSTDNSRDIIEQYRGNPKITKLIYNTQNSGSTFKQWQTGISLATGDWIWIAESDDLSKPNFLEVLLKLTEQYNNVGIAFCNSYKIDNNNQTAELQEYMTSAFKDGITEVRERLCHYNTITNASSCIIKKELAIKATTDLEKYRTCGDWIFYTRILQHGNLAYSPLKLNYYRWHQHSVSYNASKSGVYITEGVNVINNIDYKTVRFSTREFLSLCKGWLNKAGEVGFKHRFRPVIIVLVAIMKFTLARIDP